MGLFRQLWETLPAIILVTFVEVGICFSVAALVMLELMPGVGREHPQIVLALSIATAIGTQAWLVFNHRVRAYIKSRQ
jgi:hypothetical protein